MTRVVISGLPGALATVIAEGVGAADDLELVGVHNPTRSGDWAGVPYLSEVSADRVDVVVEAGPDHPVMGNLQQWRQADVAVVVGTSGFTESRLEEVRRLWQGAGRGCLVVPNFSIGAVLSMRFAEIAAPWFATTEVIERHRAGKPDAPSGTALQTATRIAAAGGRSAPKREELAPGALGGDVNGVRVHSLRLEGLLSHQEVALTNAGEQLSIVHQSTSYGSFAEGALVAIRSATDLAGGRVEVGLDRVLGLG